MENPYEDLVGQKVLSAEYHFYSMAESKLYPYYLCLMNDLDDRFVTYFSREDAEFFEQAAALLRKLPDIKGADHEPV